MFWVDVDLLAQTATLHRSECVHVFPKATDRRGVNEMKSDGGWFSFNSAGEAMRFHKVKRLSGDVKACIYCKPLDHLDDVAWLDSIYPLHAPAATPVEPTSRY